MHSGRDKTPLQDNGSQPSSEFMASCSLIYEDWKAGNASFQVTLNLVNHYINQAQESGQVANQGWALHVLGTIYQRAGDLQQSLLNFQTARHLFLKVGNAGLVGQVNLQIGQNYRFLGEAERALVCYRTAFTIGQQEDSPSLKAWAAYYEGFTHIECHRLNSARLALEATETLLQAWSEPHDTRDALRCYTGVAFIIIALREKAANEAWHHAISVNNIATANPHPLHTGLANRALGCVTALVGPCPISGFILRPEDYFHTATEAFRSIDAQEEIAHTLYCQGLYYAHHQERHLAIQHLHQGAKIFTRLGMVRCATRCTEAQYTTL